MNPAWPKLRSNERAVAAYRRAIAECEGRAAPAERGTERAAEAISLSRPRPSGAGPSGAANHFHQRTLQASAALAAAATLARPIRWRQSRSICRPKAAQQKKPPERYKRHLSGDFLVKATAPPSQHLYYTTLSRLRQSLHRLARTAGPPHGEGGGWGSPSLPRSPPRRRCAASRRQLMRSKK